LAAAHGEWFNSWSQGSLRPAVNEYLGFDFDRKEDQPLERTRSFNGAHFPLRFVAGAAMLDDADLTAGTMHQPTIDLFQEEHRWFLHRAHESST
jgi:hypothetical protein